MLTNNKTNLAVILDYAINLKTKFGYAKASQVIHILEIHSINIIEYITSLKLCNCEPNVR